MICDGCGKRGRPYRMLTFTMKDGTKWNGCKHCTSLKWKIEKWKLEEFGID
jgi:hypothetical protein